MKTHTTCSLAATKGDLILLPWTTRLSRHSNEKTEKSSSAKISRKWKTRKILILLQTTICQASLNFSATLAAPKKTHSTTWRWSSSLRCCEKNRSATSSSSFKEMDAIVNSRLMQVCKTCSECHEQTQLESQVSLEECKKSTPVSTWLISRIKPYTPTVCSETSLPQYSRRMPTVTGLSKISIRCSLTNPNLHGFLRR